ncbi:MAG: hypothetical protein Q7K42_03660 [Candidatus Diapherotrites archaeon]|nr:hypothetical protein [Candidatus Diapherotrites archaeon]
MPVKKHPTSATKRRTFPGVTRTGKKTELSRSLTNYGIRFEADGKVKILIRRSFVKFADLDTAIRAMRHIQDRYDSESQFLHELQSFVSKLFHSHKNSSLKLIPENERKQVLKKIKDLRSEFKRKPLVPEKKNFPRQLDGFKTIVEKNNINAFLFACPSMIEQCDARRREILRISNQMWEREQALMARKTGLLETKETVSRELIASAKELDNLARRKEGTKEKKEKVLQQAELIEPHIEDWGTRGSPEQIENIARHLINLSNVFRKTGSRFFEPQIKIVHAARLVREKNFVSARRQLQQAIDLIRKIAV